MIGERLLLKGMDMEVMDTLTVCLTSCKFHLGDVPDAWQASYLDDDWEEVLLPHDWSVALPFSAEYSSGTGYLAGGIGWYRIYITPVEAWRGKRISINFDGVYKNSRVWCNSTYLGERPNGYISFSYDITDYFRFDGDNIISVYVDRREIADARWFTGSGITRKVTLIVSEDIHPVPNGIFFYTPSVESQEAVFVVENEIINHKSKACLITVTNVLFDMEGNITGESLSQATVAEGKSVIVKNTGLIKNPALWSPESPNLYTLKTYLSYEKSYMVHSTSVGIRHYLFHADKGFFLNGFPYILKGVCVHEDAGCFGAAVPWAVWYRRLIKLKEMGCNAIRMSHNPHMPELYDLCDRLGFLVIDEAFDEWEAPKNKWWHGHNVFPPKHQGYYTAFPEWHQRDLRDMILRDRNHASVILWSIGNEIDYPNDPYAHPSFAEMTGNNDAGKTQTQKAYSPMRPNMERLSELSRRLCEIVKETDTTHLVTLAAAYPELSAKIGFIDPLDVVGYNYKEQLYEKYHTLYPDKPFLGSENGHSLAAWETVTQKRYISGQFLWTGIDYLGEAYGWPVHGSGAGLLTLAGFEKAGYYRRQSFWTQEPMIHLVTIREAESCQTAWGEIFEDAVLCEFAPATECWNYCVGERITVKCYTNLDRVELLLNKRSLGIFQKAEHTDCILITVLFEEGELCAQSVSDELEDRISYSLYTTGSACQIKLEEYFCDFGWDYTHDYPFVYPYSGDSYAALSGVGRRVGEEQDVAERIVDKPLLHQIEVTMLDGRGRRVYHDATMLTVTVENGVLLGLENGDLADNTEYTANYRRAYCGQLIVYAVPDRGEKNMIIRVRGEQVKEGVIVIPGDNLFNTNVNKNLSYN